MTSEFAKEVVAPETAIARYSQGLTEDLMGNIFNCQFMDEEFRQAVFLKVCDSHTGDVFADFSQEFWNLGAVDKIRVLTTMNEFNDECVYPKIKTVFLAIYFGNKHVKVSGNMKFAETMKDKLAMLNTVCPLTQQQLDEMTDPEMGEFCKNIKWYTEDQE